MLGVCVCVCVCVCMWCVCGVCVWRMYTKYMERALHLFLGDATTFAWFLFMATFCIGIFVVVVVAAAASADDDVVVVVLAADFYCCRYMQFTGESGATYA